MNSLRQLKDSELLSSTRVLVQKERELTTQVLRHLAEIDRRKLYCDLKCTSLFDYAVRELGYSEAAASRRIQAMRLVREIPEVEAKIESGTLNLSNISQAQSFFRDIKRTEPERVVTREEKKELLIQLENKSSRESEKILLGIRPPEMLPRERERMVSPEHTEVRFLINQELKTKLDEVRSLLGPKGVGLSLSELMLEMAHLSSERLAEKRFGKRRIEANSGAGVSNHLASGRQGPASRIPTAPHVSNHIESKTAESPIGMPHSAGDRSHAHTRHIPRSTKFRVWKSAKARCASCGSTYNLQFDHIQPFALGGNSTPENIQLLCQPCNLRRGIKTFGVNSVPQR